MVTAHSHEPSCLFVPWNSPHIPAPPGLGNAFFFMRPKAKRRRGPRPSPAKKGRDAARQLLFRGVDSPHTKTGSDTVQLLGEAVDVLLLGRTGLLRENFAALCSSRGKCQRRIRDFFPLPPLAKWPVNSTLKKAWEFPALTLANLCILSLNLLWSDFKQSRELTSGAPTASQIEAQAHVVGKTERMLERFSSAAGTCWHWKGTFQKFEAASLTACEPLVGAAVDLPTHAATCDPLLHVDHSLRAAVQDASSIFPVVQTSLLGNGCETPNCSAEYLALVSREILCGKLRLRLSVKAAAHVFAVGKSTAGRQRKVWNGSDLSAAAAKPPVPPRLANPSSFLDLHVQPTDPIWFSKRDAETFFDVLKVPEQLQPWFGQPAVRVRDLMTAGGWTLQFLEKLVDDLGDGTLSATDAVFPVNVVWPMGFSWSSVVAQSTTLARVAASGVALENVLSMDHPPPAVQSELCMVATDDTVFMHRDATKGQNTLACFDASLEAAGIPRKVAKDITLTEQITALGCDLTSRPHIAEPAKPKLLTCVAACLDLLQTKRASPKAVNALLGLLQWFCLLQRPVFGVFDKIYDFVRLQPDREKVCLPQPVLQEIAAALGLLPLLSVSLDKRYYNEILACDAARDFGFGVSETPCSEGVVANLGRLAERRGDFVRVHKDSSEGPEKSRLGVPHRLGVSKKDFRTILSSPAKWKAHSSTLEGHALLLTLKWLARSRSKHHRKVVVLVDAKAVLGAAAKGRTSAPGLRSVVRSIGAHTLACDLLVRLVYIPSEDNPADAPSRGKHRLFRAIARQKIWRC